MKSKPFDNDAWIRSHFEEIVDKYGGTYVLIARGRVFPVKYGENISKMEKRIRAKWGKPIGMPVPQPQDFHSVLAMSCFSSEE